MSFNFFDTGGTVFASQSCLYDANIGYETDFSIDGDVSGWTLYDGIHIYGCWNNFLFGTLYGETSLLGRHNIFKPVAAEQFYTIKIVMKLNIEERIGTQKIPEIGRLLWTTEADPSWSSSKEFDFTISADNKWHTYNINMGEVQWWQGDINNLRLCPILQDGRDGDEFFVRSIKIISIDSYKCNNTSCEYFSEYQHPCAGVGKRGTCSSKELDSFVQEGTVFDFAVDKKYTIVEDSNDELLVNINDYGYESIKLPITSNSTGTKMAKIITKEISKINVGGYSEVFVEYTTVGQFVIHSGTYVSDSTVKIGNSEAAVTFDFYDEFGNSLCTESTGESPVSGYRPLSSFRVDSNKILSLFSGVESTGFFFNPFIYNIEGGRRDWLDYGLGVPSRDVRGQEDDDTGIMNRYYDKINNAGKTIIDFNHPFNASGRITKLYLAVTLDDYSNSYDSRGDYDEDRIDTQLENAKVMFFRPLKDGTLKVLNKEVSIENRDHASGNLYSATQEYVEIDCDVFVNKGDLIGVYNAHMYKGRSVSGSETDALFYQNTGKASGILEINTPLGEGSSGLLLYARSDQIQNRLVVELDLSKRINIESVDVIGSAVDEKLEYNIARCLDINWTVDLFDEDHTTGWVISYSPYVDGRYNHPNIYYGKDCLTDGIKTVPDGLSATSFSIDLGTYYTRTVPPHIQNGGDGVIIYGAKYFQVNGDSEWLANYLLAGRQSPFAVEDFKRDPIAFTLLIPYGKKKNLNKLKVYFKERYNFRSFALSFFKGDSYQGGTADISTFDLIPYRSDGVDTPWSRLILDGLDYVPENETEWGAVDLYLSHNPVVGHEILEASSVQIGNYDPVLAYYGGSPTYDERGTIINNDQLVQARSVDWTTLSIEWPTSNELGFRLYCDYHESTKICEMELFCTVEDVGSSMAGAVSVTYSTYGETLWLSDPSQDIYGNVTAFIGDTPRYITVEIAPITEIELKSINVNIGEGGLFVGEKGCQSMVLPEVSKINEENTSVPILFKNVYNGIYDLYVDIIKDIRTDDGLIFYSRLNNKESITDPEVGSDSYYKKEPRYAIRNDNYNVAINCPVYGLKNLVDGAEAWYSYDAGYSWNNWGPISSGGLVDFGKLSEIRRTVVNLPVLKRSKWWKIGFFDPTVSMKAKEMKVYYRGKEIENVNFYHNKGQSYTNGGNTDTAPHLNDEIIDGSYYVLTENQYISIELPGIQKIDQIVMYHEFLKKYENTVDVAGIDSSTAFCLKGYGNLYQTDTIHDYSYYEHGLKVVGNGIYCDNTQSNSLFNGSSIQFNANVDEYIEVDYDNNTNCNVYSNGFDFMDKSFTIDTFIKFRALPSSGNKAVVISCWSLGDNIGTGTHADSSWAVVVENVSGDIKLRVYTVENNVSKVFSDYSWNPNLDRWYHFYFCHLTEKELSSCYKKFLIDGSMVLESSSGVEEHVVDTNNNSIRIGENFDGWLQELRVSVDYAVLDFEGGGGRIMPGVRNYGPPTKPFERYYTFSLYISEDNITYGHYVDVDTVFSNSYSWYHLGNIFSSDYYSYFAIDLGHSYALDIVRSFPVDEAYQFDLLENITYSNIDTSDPALAFKALSIEDINTDFSGVDKTVPNNWKTSGGSENYILSNKLYQSINTGYVNLTAEFYLVGDFDIEIEYELINNVNIDSWFCGLQVQDLANVDNLIKMDRAFYSSHNRYRFNVRDDSSSWTTVFDSMTNHRMASIRFVRSNQIFISYIKNIDVSYPEEYVLFGYYAMTGGFGEETILSIISESITTDYPTISVEWDNLIFNSASPIYSFYNDARWLKIRMLSGDGVTRIIKRIGVYPDISVQVSADGYYNTEWKALGNSITSYVRDENIALSADVEASSSVGVMVPENAVNGLLTTELQQAWGSEKGTPQWITITLPQEMQIYRIKLHLGYDDSDTDHLIQNYTVQISDDNESFNTIFTITGNTSFLRTHDLIEPVTASYVRIYITAYTYKKVYVETLDGYKYWEGLSLRQIEVYEYYGNTIVSSEDYPIIAIDLKQNYFIRGHDLVGVDTENTEIDWDNSDSNYTYSNSNLSEPKKVTFGEWGDTPIYEKWVVIKRNTATHYPLIPDEDYPYRDTEDYLKHVKVYGSVNEGGDKPNPVEHDWMWRSNISELSYSYDYVKRFSARSLSIKYPASSQSDHIYFIEGDDFGIDESFSWRDGLGFYWYVDNIENLDLSYGYIYFGGYDPTDSNNSVTYKWNIMTLSGVLQSGWNGVVLGMKYADEVDWTELADPEVADPRILDKLILQKMGMIFKGKGVPVTMYINGFIIERSHFKEGGFFDRGLYLHGNDILKINVGELDFHSGTLEFFVRPDWDLTAKDTYREFKFRSLFHFGNVANDILGASITPLGIEVYHGNLMDDLTLFRITDLDFGGIDQIMHMAFVFSNDGTNIGNDGSTLRVYVNSVLIAKSTIIWKVSDEKHFNFIFGGQSLLMQKMQGFIPKSSSVDGVISNIKIHNYCKTDFRDSIRSADIEGDILLTKPSDLIEISKNNVTFYGVGDEELPFYFKNVPSNEVVPVYVKTTIPKGLTGKEKRTAEILGQWDIGV